MGLESEESGPKLHKHRDNKLPSIKTALSHVAGHGTAIIPHIHFKTWTEDDDADWWFAGTAVPLLAATLGPAANVLSTAALVTSWRVCLVEGVDPVTCPYNGNATELVNQLNGYSYHDPGWAYHPNIVSLICGCLGNIFLLFNFTGFVRYKVSLPVTIIMFYIASGIYLGILVAMHVYQPPVMPQQTYSQGFWYGVLAASLYLIAAMLLMLNMVGFFLGHFPEHFNLTESQRTLINQTIMFFVWLAGGAAVFNAIETNYGDNPEEWGYINGLYFCDVTILTVGFGDLTPTSALGRAIVFPYAIIGITALGLVITSIAGFAAEIGSDKVIMKHQERSRARTFDRSMHAAEQEQLKQQRRRSRRSSSIAAEDISRPYDAINRTESTRIRPVLTNDSSPLHKSSSLIKFAGQTAKVLTPKPLRSKPKPENRELVLREERQRFETMRRLQRNTLRYKHWMSLTLSLFCFAMLWLLGAVAFFYAEGPAYEWTYFEALYFCYVSLLTIGYGDFAPSSNIGRPFFVVWSLIAVPTMTILFSALGNTAVAGFREGINKFAEYSIMPRVGAAKHILDHLPIYKQIAAHVRKEAEARRLDDRLREGFQVGVEAGPNPPKDEAKIRAEALSLEELARKAIDGTHPRAEILLARRLAAAIQTTAVDLRTTPPRTYTYDEWFAFTQLIRFTNYTGRDARGATVGPNDTQAAVEETKELIEWDWIGENSPMMTGLTEAQFVLDRLCESMGRYTRQMAVRAEEHAHRTRTARLDEEETIRPTSSENSEGSTADETVDETVVEEGTVDEMAAEEGTVDEMAAEEEEEAECT